VRALLAKAESTEFPDEAEALSAKAQELMSRYSLQQAMTEHHRGRAVAAAGRRLWMDAPYAGAKALLVQVVATANRCRAVWSEKLGFITVVGADTDLDMVELLSTSLLVQANRAMLGAGRHITRAGTSRTRSFRQSFLLAYASRIGERLDTASAVATAEVAGEVARSGRLLPVLAARSRAADELTDRLFPTMTQRSLSVNNAAGWSAGRAAAELALFDVHASIAG
jgi:capsid protein